MFRSSLLALALLALVLAPLNAATISMSSTLADWEAAGLLHSDFVGDNPGGAGAPADILKWGVTIQDGVIYGIMQNATSLTPGTPASAYRYYASLAINADGNDLTQIFTDDTIIHPLYPARPHNWVGTDIYIELSNSQNYNWWGIDGTDTMSGAVTSTEGEASISEDGTVFRLSISLAALEDKLKLRYEDENYTLPIGFGADNVHVRLAGRHGAGLQIDTGDLGEIVPEPGTVTLLLGAALSFCGVAIFRRK